MAEDYQTNRDYYPTDLKWRQQGKKLLDAVQDADAELKTAKRNFRILVLTYPITLALTGLALFVAIALGITPGIQTASIIASLVGVAACAIHGGEILTAAKRTGKTRYDNSLLHHLEKHRRVYHAWLEVDAEPKPEPKLVSTEVVPKKKKSTLGM